MRGAVCTGSANPSPIPREPATFHGPSLHSVDSHFTHLAWTQKSRKEGGLGPMDLTLLADKSHAVTKAYGVQVEDGPDAGVSYRGLFIIDPSGNLRQITVNDLPVGRSVDETLRLVQAFQFVEEHGEV